MSNKILQRVEQGHTYAADTNLTVMCCPTCGVTYAIPHTLQANEDAKARLAARVS